MTSELSEILRPLSDQNWSLEALEFICDGIMFTNKIENELDSQSLSDGISLFSVHEFGPLAIEVLNALNFKDENDFIRAVNYLLSKKVLNNSSTAPYPELAKPEYLSKKLSLKSLNNEEKLLPPKKIDIFQRFLKNWLAENLSRSIISPVASIAQLIEQLTCNQQVVGLSPTAGS